MTKAFSLFSGGLDSLLAARVVMEQGVDVIALHFITPFFGYKSKGREEDASEGFKNKYGLTVRIIDITKEYIEMVRKPMYGYGKNFNPCLDCKIFMMRKAKAIMLDEGADFIISGEVLGQRPMSQRRDAMSIVERDSGLKGFLLRPLCAKLLAPTIPEQKGLIDREKLYGFSGRARRDQMDLAEKLGIKDYATPAGGCMLTDQILSNRVRDLLLRKSEVDVRDVQLLAVGRIFRLQEGTLNVGRNEKDNDFLLSLSGEDDVIMRTEEDVPGPVSLLRGNPTEEDINLAAGITARYSDARKSESVTIIVSLRSGEKRVQAKPVQDATIDERKI